MTFNLKWVFSRAYVGHH